MTTVASMGERCPPTGTKKQVLILVSLHFKVSECCVWQVWLCGGSIEVIPCSKIAHIERARKPYLPDLSITMKRNALRVAEVWLDEYKYNVNIAWNLPLEVRHDPSFLTYIGGYNQECIPSTCRKPFVAF